MRRPSSSSKDFGTSIPAKANKLLNMILAAMLLILFRLWHLTVVQHDEKLEESKKPQHRVIIERAERATIRDRFNLPLAINKVQSPAPERYGWGMTNFFMQPGHSSFLPAISTGATKCCLQCGHSNLNSVEGGS